MIRPTTIVVASALAAAVIRTVAVSQYRAGADEGVEVKLCDNHTTTTVPAGQPATHENGEKIAKALMDQWKRANPNAKAWIEEERAKHTIVEPADNSGLVGSGQGATYGQISTQDVATWREETLKMVVEGSTVFHSADRLGSTIAVSCDMCHPDAANTHPETYPKFQPQLGRVALLRDMINWCIQHPVRGEQLAADDERMRALEAYITAQRNGTKLDYGRR